MKPIFLKCFLVVLFVCLFAGGVPHVVSAQVPMGGFISLIYTGACTASAPTASPFVLIGPTPGLYMYIPGSLVFPYGPPSHPGQEIMGWSGGFYACLFWSTCPPVGEPCPLPFPPHPGGMIVLSNGSAF